MIMKQEPREYFIVGRNNMFADTELKEAQENAKRHRLEVVLVREIQVVSDYRKPREFWVRGNFCHASEEDAARHHNQFGGGEIIHVREVI